MNETSTANSKFIDTTKFILEKEAVFIIGKVSSVEGRTITIEVNKNKNHSHIIYDGETIKNVSVGSYIKVIKGFTVIIGKVEGEYIQEEKYYNREYSKEETRVSRFLKASLFGHYESSIFKQGIKEMPLIDNECFVLDREEFRKLHNFSQNDEPTINIGALTEEPSQKINLSIDKLFASHIGIFGNTGSGKSNTLARIYTNLFNYAFVNLKCFKKNSKFVVIDFNGEYAGDDVLCKEKKVIHLNTRKDISKIRDDEKYPVDVNTLEDPEILSVILDATEKTQKPFLANAIRSEYLRDQNNYTNAVMSAINSMVVKKQPEGVSKIVEFLSHISPYVNNDSQSKLEELITKIRQNVGQDSKGSYMWAGNYRSDIYEAEIKPALEQVAFSSNIGPLDNIQLRIYLRFYYKIATSGINAEHIGPLINRMQDKFKTLAKVICVKAELPDENIIVVSMKRVRLEMRKILPLVICKQVYDYQKLRNDEKDSPETSLHILIDEAHNILSEDSERESDAWKDYRLETFEEIIKEGRKFGVFLTLASQRPYDISPTIISQLHNYFIHRLINNNDLNAIKRAVAYLDQLSFESIPILPAGNCFVAGLAADIPIKVDIKLLAEEKRPRSGTIELIKAWT